MFDSFSFGKWLVSERLHKSCELLESSSLSIEQIAQQVGFQTAITFRQHFRERYMVSPRCWRKTFKGKKE